MNKPILYYIHDPMCSWCWGFTTSLNQLLEKLPSNFQVKRVLGGLAIDTDQIMPLSMQESIKSNWTNIEKTIPGVKFNFDFWKKVIPRRSTYSACRAVIAARLQEDKFDGLMTKAIQRAYYQEARNPSDNSILISLAGEIGLSVSVFEKEFLSDEVQSILDGEIELSRSLYAESFPSLVLDNSNEFHSIKIDYKNSSTMIEDILHLTGSE